jgi:hypothetical protein
MMKNGFILRGPPMMKKKLKKKVHDGKSIVYLTEVLKNESYSIYSLTNPFGLHYEWHKFKTKNED